MKKYLFIFVTLSLSQSISDYTYTGAEVSALAGAVVSKPGNTWSIFHNPAGIAEINDRIISASSGNLYGYNWLPYNNLSATLPFSFGNISFGAQQIKTKHKKSNLATEQTFSLAQGFYLQKDYNSQLAFGYTANITQWNLGKSAGITGDGEYGLDLGTSQTVTIDIGFLASLRDKYRFGVFVKNINSDAIGKGMTRHVLPRRINVGATYIPIKDLITSLVMERLLGRDELSMRGSIKYELNSYFIMNVGAQSNPNRMGIGGTINYNRTAFSYGIITHPILSITQQFTISMKL